nr:MAG TPA: hypothetical protein [Caudoviricetes sp.]
MITLNNINLSSIDLSGIDLRGIKLGLGGRGSGSGDGFPQLPGDVTRWHFGGLTNEMMAAMDDPRIEDADHKGRFLSFKNFAWGGMSGVGGYVDNWNSSADWDINSYWVNSHTDHKLQFITAGSIVQARSNNIYNAENVYKNILNVNGLTEAVNKGSVKSLRISATDPITSKAIKTFSFDTDGVIQISFDDVLQDYYVVYFVYGNNTNDIDITIEQIPLYPGALVFDGVDDYGTCENFPILTKEKGYTVVVLRQWITYNPNAISAIATNASDRSFNGAFTFENYNKGAEQTISYGATQISLQYSKSPFSWQTASKYNGFNIANGNKDATNSLVLGRSYPQRNEFANFAIWELVFLDHDATEEELTKIKDYFVKTYPWLFPDQAWTVTGKTNEDEDRATIANITGNGNDLVLSNFGFAEGSGYGLYKTPFELYPSVQHSSKYSLSFSKFALGDHNLIIAPKQNDLSYDIKVKVTGLKDGVKFKWGWIGTTGYIDITTDGIHMLNKPASQIRQLIVEFAEDFDPDHVVTIEQIPEYEGYLVTDGVDDKINSSNFDLGKDWAIVGDWTMLSNIPSNCGIIKASSLFLYNSIDSVTIYINNGGRPIKIQSKSINAICSDGRIYLNDWTEISKPGVQTELGSKTNLNITSYGTTFTKMAFKNLGIYNNQILSKDDCIKAYNYLQTLKAK